LVPDQANTRPLVQASWTWQTSGGTCRHSDRRRFPTHDFCKWRHISNPIERYNPGATNVASIAARRQQNISAFTGGAYQSSALDRYAEAANADKNTGTAYQTVGGASGFQQISTGGYPQDVVYDGHKGYLYVTNNNDNTVNVIKDMTNAVIATVKVGSQPMGIAFDDANGDVYTANFGDNTISVISDSTNTIVATIDLVPLRCAPCGAWAIAYDSHTNNLYAALEESGIVAVISGSTNTIQTTVPLLQGSSVEAITFNPWNNDLYLTNAPSGGVTVIADSTNAIVATIPDSAFNYLGTSMGIAVDTYTGNVYVTSSHNVFVISYSTQQVIRSYPELPYPHSIAFDPALADMYITINPDANISVIQTSSNTALPNIILPTNSFPTGITYDSATGNLYVVESSLNSLAVVPTVQTLTSITTSIGSSSCTLWTGQTTCEFNAKVGQTVSVNIQNGQPDSTYTLTIVVNSQTSTTSVTTDSKGSASYSHVLSITGKQVVTFSGPGVNNWTLALNLPSTSYGVVSPVGTYCVSGTCNGCSLSASNQLSTNLPSSPSTMNAEPDSPDKFARSSDVFLVNIPSSTASPPLPNSVTSSSSVSGIDYWTEWNNGWGDKSPSDVQIAAGPNHVVEMVNLAAEIWAKSGSSLSTPKMFALSSFFLTSDSLSDPRILYDATSHTWFASLTDKTPDKNGIDSVKLAVSKTSDPTGCWLIYSVTSMNTSGVCYDQPIIGVSDDKLVISANDASACLSNGLYGAEYWVLNKNQLIAGSSTNFNDYGPISQLRVSCSGSEFEFHAVHGERRTERRSYAYLVYRDGCATRCGIDYDINVAAFICHQCSSACAATFRCNLSCMYNRYGYC
jgi:YVTN family beta-propeller protein